MNWSRHDALYSPAGVWLAIATPCFSHSRYALPYQSSSGASVHANARQTKERRSIGALMDKTRSCRIESNAGVNPDGETE